MILTAEKDNLHGYLASWMEVMVMYWEFAGWLQPVENSIMFMFLCLYIPSTCANWFFFVIIS